MKPHPSMIINPDGWAESGVNIQSSPNHNARPTDTDITLIVIHNISLPPNEFGGDWITDLFMNRLDPQAHPYFATIYQAEVSSHFLIRRDGEIVQYVSTLERAWHAGRSCWRGEVECNHYSVGIELEGSDTVPFTHAQYHALARLTCTLRARHPTINSVAGHSEIAPTRKTDPGPCFEWARFEVESRIPPVWREPKP